MNLAALRTPALVLDRLVVARNAAAMSARARRHGIALRPHVKTAKCVEVARLATEGQPGAITVSTLAEAEYFAAHGFRDITYAVGLSAGKLDDAVRLRRDGIALRLLVDNLEAARALADRARAQAVRLEAFIEIDSGQRRAGLDPEARELVPLGEALNLPPFVALAGVLTHAGQSYHAKGAEAIARVAEAERTAVLRAAERLRAAGLPCPVLSTGATPTATHGRSFEGLSEIRPGNYVFHDLTMVSLGVCRIEDVAVSVLASVIGHHKGAGHILIDAGFMALSKDLGAHDYLPDAGFGYVMEERGRARLPGLSVTEVNQEHGMIKVRGSGDYERLPVGARVRVLPNHSCATAAMYGYYNVVEGADDNVLGRWARCTGW
jgi:D-serine deaminase-like pyridoxal phosphate-dependent protein